MGTYKKICTDFKAFKKANATVGMVIFYFLANSGFRAVVLYRVGASFRRRKLRILANLVERIMHHACNCWISTSAIIDEGLTIRHVGCIVIGSKVRIGPYCDIRQGITIGGNMGKKDEDGNTQPVIGANVLIGAGAQILGPIKLGDFCVVGANAVVVKSFPSNCVVGGVPAKLLRMNQYDK